MSLNVEAPETPELGAQNPDEYDDVDDVGVDDYRREELEASLREGAWEGAFDEWSEHTDIDETEFRIAVEMGLFREFDFFWDDYANRVGFHAPGIPEDWRERDLHEDLDSWNAVSGINAAMTELGQIVSDVLEAEYVGWSAEYDAPDDLPDFEE